MESLKDFLLWARDNRMQVTRLKSGDVEIEMVDLDLLGGTKDEAEPARPEGWAPPHATDSEDIYQELARQRGVIYRGPAVNEVHDDSTVEEL